MNKSIESLVDDIQDLFRKPHEVDEARVDELGRGLAGMVRRRLGEERGATYLRMSNLGKGDRQLWYDINEPSADELTPSNKIKFLFGDILELLLLFLAEEAGHKVERKQEQVNVDGISGSLDAVIDNVVVDCKSASTPSFKKFKSGGLAEDDPFGYMEQLGGYVEGVGGDKDGAFLVIDKTLGNIHLDHHDNAELKQLRIPDRITHLKEVVSSEVLPERCYPDRDEGKSGNRVLGVNCSYCAHKFKCWKDSNGGIGLRTFAYSKGPTYFTHVAKEPNVLELTF